jgi:hypothetical protein
MASVAVLTLPHCNAAVQSPSTATIAVAVLSTTTVGDNATKSPFSPILASDLRHLRVKYGSIISWAGSLLPVDHRLIHNRQSVVPFRYVRNTLDLLWSLG